jgi:hypothetical protein
MWVGGQRHDLATLPPGKETRYPLHRRFAGLEGRSERVQRVSLPGFNHRTVQSAACSYTDWATTANFCPTCHFFVALCISGHDFQLPLELTLVNEHNIGVSYQELMLIKIFFCLLKTLSSHISPRVAYNLRELSISQRSWRRCKDIPSDKWHPLPWEPITKPHL